MVKVLHIISSLDIGGAEMMLYKLVSNHKKKNISHHIICLNKNGKLINRIRKLKIKVYCLNFTSILNFIKSLNLLISTVKMIKPDVIMTWLYAADLVGIFLKFKFPNIKLIWNLRCSELKFPYLKLTTFFVIKILRLFSSYPNLLIANSYSGLKSHLNLGYKTKNKIVIPNGFDTNYFRPDLTLRKKLRLKYNISENDTVLGFIGKTTKIKGMDTFIEASAYAIKMKSNFKFVFIGPKLDRNNFELVNKLKKIKCFKNSILLGEQKQLNEVILILDILSLTSLSEGFPNVIGESMSCQIPCVTTDVGDCKKIIGNYGIVTSSFNPKKIASDWYKLYDLTKKDKTIYKSCRKRIMNNYSIIKIVKQYNNIFLSLKNEK